MSRTADLLRSVDLSSDEIAGRTGLSVERIRELEQGKNATLSELTKLSKGLRVSFETMAKGGARSDNEDLRLLFRQTGAFREHLDPTHEFVARFVEAALDVLPARQALPEWMDGLVVEEESYEQAEELAAQVRERLYPDNLFEPIPRLAIDLGNNGVVVARLHQSRFEGASLLLENHPFIFVSPRFSGRMLFTLAHELGHVVAHHPHERQAIFEKASEIGAWRQKKREAFVDAFASIFLMPARGVGLMLNQIRSHFQIERDAVGDIEILLLARFYGVSFDVAARRCENLELLPPGGAWSLSSDIKKKHGSPEKRAEAANLPPRVEVALPQISENLMEAIGVAIGEERRSIGWIADRFALSVNEIFAENKRMSSEHYH